MLDLYSKLIESYVSQGYLKFVDDIKMFLKLNNFFFKLPNCIILEKRGNWGDLKAPTTTSTLYGLLLYN